MWIQSVHQAAKAAVLLFIVSSSLSSLRAGNIFLQLPGITGSSTDPQHPGWIDVTSFSCKSTGPNRAISFPGSLGPIVIQKAPDASSPLIGKAVASGLRGNDAILQVTRPESTRIPWYTIRLEVPSVISFNTQGSWPEGRGGGLVEQVGLRALGIQWTSTEFDAKGRPVLEYNAKWVVVSALVSSSTNAPGAVVLSGQLSNIGQWQVSWDAVAGRSYDVLQSESIAGPFTLVQTLNATQAGKLTYTSPTAVFGWRFYQVVTRSP